MGQKRYAYLMGANGPQMPYKRPLHYAEQDAQRLANALNNHPCSFTKTKCVTATSRDITLLELQSFSRECESSDLFIIHFSGHAIYDEHLYLICNETDPDLLIASAIDIESIKGILRQCRASHKLLILDCCHASAAHYGALKGPPMIEEMLETLQGSASIILSACSRRERARELETLDEGAGFLSWAVTAACTNRFMEVSPDQRSLSLHDIWNWLPKALEETNNTLSEKDRIPKPVLLSEMEGGKDGEIWFTPQRRKIFTGSDYDEQRHREKLAINGREKFLRQYCDGARIDGFDRSKIIEYAERQNDYENLSLEDIEQLCKQLDLISDSGIPRRASVLAFHRTPERHLHSALVRVIAETSSGERYVQEEIKGSLSEQVEKTIKWIKSNLRTVSENVRSGKRVDRYELPETAIRELVVNAILHRDYKSSESVIVKITGKQIIITNPGKIKPSILECTPPFSYKHSHPRNPFLLQVLVAQKWAEGHSRGFEIVLEEFIKNHLDLPEITNLSSGLVQVIINRPQLDQIIAKKVVGFDDILNGDLENRLNFIINELPHFWANGPHSHFTNHGPSHSERIYRQKLAQLAKELPLDQRLNEDETFIVSAAAWLYEIGMQSTNLKPILDFNWQPGTPLTTLQLQQIHENKHLLTHRMILDSVRKDYDGPPLRLGLLHDDGYTRLIAEVCRWCSNESLEMVEEVMPLRGVMVRVRLLVALLRLADQLYIDSSRVNLDLLQAAHLSEREEARWGAYHYVQTLPIDKGRIRFQYFLPIVHKPLLGHIRALIEPNFEYNINPNLRYLWSEQGLRLIVDNEPSVSFDQPAGFQREMSREMVEYLRQEITPIPTFESLYGGDNDENLEDRNILVLDYENFILQLGLEGYFPAQEEIGRLLVMLLKEANAIYTGPVNALAVGHWERPDLAPIASMLKARVYNLLTVEDREKPSEALMRQLSQVIQGAHPPKNILLVAPHQDLAPIIRRFSERRRTVSAWIGDSTEADIYHALLRDVQSLSQTLRLSSVSTNLFDLNEREIGQAACILSLGDSLLTDKYVILLEEFSSILKEVELAKGKMDWWRLWLISQEILIPEYVNEHYTLKMNEDHPEVIRVRAKRDAIIAALQSLAQHSQGVQQNDLVNNLSRLPLFQNGTEKILQFLEILKEENIIHVDVQISGSDQPIWHLNSSHSAYVAFQGERYLPLLVLGFDFFLVREGYPVIHEHTLTRRLTPYLGESIIEFVYRLALKKGWVQRRASSAKFRNSNVGLVDVRLAKDHNEVRAIMHNLDMLLDILYRKSSTNGLERDALWSILSHIESFTLSRDQANDWLSVFQHESLVLVEADPYNSERDCLRLNYESTLVRRLLGRMNAYGIVQTLRIMGATSSERGQSSGQVVDRLAKYITHDKQLAAWTLEYAKSIKLVEVVKSGLPNDVLDVIFLKRQHSFVHELDQQEAIVCQILVELVGKLSQRRFHEGWVPLQVITQEMEKDLKFGLTKGEYDYWINQAVHRRKFLEIRTERASGHPPQTYIRVLSHKDS